VRAWAEIASRSVPDVGIYRYARVRQLRESRAVVKPCALLLSIFAVGTCAAAPMVLKCNAVPGGPFVFTLTVDLEGKWMRFGDYSTYKIISMNDRYITGFEDNDKHVGGELWVLDRETGEFWRAAVFLGWGANVLTPEQLRGTALRPPETMQSATYSGKCNRPI
jgi:hypothetical protein